MKIMDGGDNAADDELLIFNSVVYVLGEKSAVSVRHHFNFNAARLESVGAEPRWATPPECVFAILVSDRPVL